MTRLIVGCGYLGRRIGRELARRGQPAIGTVRTTGSAEALKPWGVTPFLLDVLEPAAFQSLPAAEQVIYCVGFDRSAGRSMREVYVDGLGGFLQACPATVRRLVYISATSVYGQNQGEWVDEDSPAQPLSDSGRVCLEAEQTAARICEARGIALVILRCSGLYGPDRVLRRASLERGEPVVGDPSKFLNMIHIDDAADAALLALDHGVSGRVYLASDSRPLPRSEFYNLIASSLGAPAPTFRTPEPDSPEARRDEGNKRISNRRLVEELGLVFTYPDCRTGIPAAVLASKPAP